MKRIVVQFATTSIHFAASLEIIDSLNLEDRKNSRYYLWGGKTKLPNRMAISLQAHGATAFRYRKAVNKAGCNNFSTVFKFNPKWVDKVFESLIGLILEAESIEALKNVASDGINPSAALANELATIFRDKNVSLKPHSKLIKRLVRSYLEVYSATQLLIKAENPDLIYIFNGRFLSERAVRDCADFNKTEIEIFETTRDRYQLRKLGFHNRQNNQKVMRDLWDTSTLSKDEKIIIGSKYFAELRSKNNPFARKTKSEETIPVINKPYFVYYSNSDDESVGFWDEWKENLGSQLTSVKKLQAIFDNQSRYFLFIRLHPNLANKSNSEKGNWGQLSNTKNSLVIGPASEISSYSILDKSQGVISFGSTLGLEAAHAKIPSLLLADSGYDELEVADKASSWEDVRNWIENASNYSHEILNQRFINSCKRGFYLEQAGHKFRNTNLVNVGWGAWDARTFKGVRLDPRKISFYLQKLIFKLKWKAYVGQ